MDTCLCGCLDGAEKSGKMNTRVAAVILRKWSPGEGVACTLPLHLLLLCIVCLLFVSRKHILCKTKWVHWAVLFLKHSVSVWSLPEALRALGS